MDKFIDVRKLIKDKNPTLYKYTPNFLINYLRKILHEDDVNEFLRLHKKDYNQDFADSALVYFDVSTEVYGIENVPREGGAIFAANHPLGGMDAMTVISALREVRKDLKFIVNDVLLNLDNLRDMFAGVNKFGGNVKESLRKVDEIFQSEQGIFVFPAGLVSRKIKGEIKDLEWKKTFISRAKKYEKPIVPVYIEGRLSNFFYRLSKIRKMLGIKKNIEMLFLVDEFYKQNGVKVSIYFGKPIMPHELSSDFSDQSWAQRIKDLVYDLPKNRT